MKRSIVLALLVLIAIAVPASAEEIKLSTIVPDQQIVRGKDAAIGDNYRKKTDADVTDGNLIVEGNIGVGMTDPKTALDVNGLIRTARYSLSGAPAPSADNKGAIFYNTDDNKMYYSNGSSWQPMGGGWAHSGTVIFNAKSPNNADPYTDLDTTVGGRAFVFLKIKNFVGPNGQYFVFRTKGDTENAESNDSSPSGPTAVCVAPGKIGYVAIETDSNGYVQWRGTVRLDTVITLAGYVAS